MCFSAGASFTAGVVIAAVGVITLKETHRQSQRIFASIPLIFAIQQIAEGCLWLTLNNPDHAFIQKISTYIYLLAADVLWPVLIPLSVLLMEERPERRKILRILLLAGIMLSMYYAHYILFFRITPENLNCHIYYNTAAPKSLMIPAFLTYLAVTLTSLFVSSVKRMYLLGILMFLACVASVIFYTKHVTSVWCFFAAIISMGIFWLLRNSKRNSS